jgi:hypothetical protein
MNKQLITTLLILGFPLTTYALQPQQGGDSGLQTTGLRIERNRMENELGLNEEAKAKVETIINDETMKIKALRKNNPSTRHSYTKSHG